MKQLIVLVATIILGLGLVVLLLDSLMMQKKLLIQHPNQWRISVKAQRTGSISRDVRK